MASIWDVALMQGKKHGVAESTLMMATNAGHFLNGIHKTEDVDNGSVVVMNIENYVEKDVIEVQAPTVSDKVWLVLTAPKIYSEHNSIAQEECYFYNGAGEIMRCYEIFENDRFSLSTEAFDDDAVPEVKKYVTVKDGSFKLTVVNEEPADNAFVGYIYDIATNGKYRIFVKKNG